MKSYQYLLSSNSLMILWWYKCKVFSNYLLLTCIINILHHTIFLNFLNHLITLMGFGYTLGYSTDLISMWLSSFLNFIPLHFAISHTAEHWRQSSLVVLGTIILNIFLWNFRGRHYILKWYIKSRFFMDGFYEFEEIPLLWFIC